MSALNPQHPMSQFGQENALKFLALVIWKLRKHCPNLALEITQQDMEQLAEVFMANGQRGVVAIIGKRDSVVLQLMDEATGKALSTPANDENSPNAKMMRQMLDARKRAQSVADRLLAAGHPEYVDKALLREAADILKLLTWEPTA